MKIKYRKINDLKFRIFEWGSAQKPVLLFLHGWMDTGASFEFIANKLSKKYYCVAPDLRGFGKTEHTKNPLGYFFYEHIADTFSIIKKYSPNRKIKLIGHSMGGNVSSLLVGSYPGLVDQFVNLEGLGLQDMDEEWGPPRVRHWLDSFMANSKSFRIYPNLKSVALRFQLTNPNLDDDKALFLAKQMTQKIGSQYQIAADPRHKWVNPYLFKLDQLKAFWAKIDAKVLNVVAENTEMEQWLKSGRDIHEEINARLKCFPKGSKKKILKKCGHMMHHERPDELAEVILKFLK